VKIGEVRSAPILPASVNVDELRTELVRNGVKVDLIDTCIKKVEKLSSPPLSSRLCLL
jgi:hypothetical protein